MKKLSWISATNIKGRFFFFVIALRMLLIPRRFYIFDVPGGGSFKMKSESVKDVANCFKTAFFHAKHGKTMLIDGKPVYPKDWGNYIILQ